MTIELALFILRLLFLAILYGFILVVIRIILRDIRSAPADPQAAREKGGPRLLVLDSDFEGIIQNQVFELRPLTTIGRAPTSDIVLQDTYASSDHAVMLSRDGKWFIQDLNSTNGTLVNRKPVFGENAITHGDVIQIGGTRLKVIRS